MNAGFEDALVFKEILVETGDDLSKAVPLFATRRRPDADAISILSWCGTLHTLPVTRHPGRGVSACCCHGCFPVWAAAL
jgi:2-polyprenyl-6-methoxyphenol hydroxylase-like FAD-dependent oxidoreductase